MKVKPSNLVQTIERVSMILDLVSRSSQGVSIRDLSDELKLPKGTVHRLLLSLSYFGYIKQDLNTKKYLLGLKLLELGNLIINQLDLRKLAEPLTFLPPSSSTSTGRSTSSSCASSTTSSRNSAFIRFCSSSSMMRKAGSMPS